VVERSGVATEVTSPEAALIGSDRN
jgi:hypothetical protein